MMDWLLILTLTVSGPTPNPPVSIAVGRMTTPQVCRIAGAGMALILEQASPGLTVTIACMHEVAA